MPVFRVSAATLTKDIEQFIRSDSRTRNWRVNVTPVRERVLIRTFNPAPGPHQCWVEFTVQDSVSSSLVNTRVCQTAHESGRVKEHVLRSLEMRYR